MDAFGSVPLTIHISCDSKDMVLRRWVKPLSKVFDFTEIVMHRGSEVFYFLFDDDRLRESTIDALLVHGQSNAI